MEYQPEDLFIDEQSTLEVLTLQEANILQKYGAMVQSIFKKDGRFESELHEETRIVAGDRLIIIGTRDQLYKLEDTAGNAI